MSTRNLILLIIVLAIIVVIAFGFFFLYQPASQPAGTSQGTNFLADFLPFGKDKTTTPTDTTPANVSEDIPTSGVETQNVKLMKISSFPVAGYGIFMKERFKDVPTVTPTEQTGVQKTITLVVPPSEFMPAIRYVNKATGNIYQTFADRIDERQFSSTVIPRVSEAYFGNKGESVIMRYLKEDNKTIETFIGSLPREYLGADSAGMDEIKGSFLPENISNISILSDASKIFYLFNTENTAVGITLALGTNAKTQIFDSPLAEWLSFWPNNKMITITTKPSATVQGLMYAINPDKKDFSKILGGINGLTTLTSPDGKMVLYGDNNLALNIFNINTGDSVLLGVKTLPEKCVWGGASDIIYCAVPKFADRVQYPDSWYQGEISFSDEIWKIDVMSGNTTMLLDPISAGGGEIDGIKLSLDENQVYLFFMNKKDSYLWELHLK